MRHLICAMTALHCAAADWQFKSRPDLAPPRLNITISASTEAEKGYIFIAPFAGIVDSATSQHGPRQSAPYIFRDDGDLVWSGYGIYSIWNANFQAGVLHGKPILFSFEGDHNPGYGHGHGHITILDKHYETVHEVRAGNHKISDKHEFHIIDESTALIQIYQPVPRDLTPYGASKDQQWIVDAIFQELDIETGHVLFEWSSLDYVDPDESVLPINPGQAGSGYNSSDAWDYFHINSVDKNADGDYIISARNACSVHKINGTDGSIIWRLDGKNSSFHLEEGVKFCFQHHARFHPELKAEDDGNEIEIISLYNNAAHGTENGRGKEIHTAKTSSGKIIKLNTTSWTATLVQGFYPPASDPILSKSQGSTQLLPNGNALVNWGSSGALTEYSPNGTALFHTYFDSDFLNEGVENYRGFRYNWTGIPSESPALVAFQNSGHTAISVSWNGDTETKVWRFYSIAGHRGSRKFLGEVERKSFETTFEILGDVKGEIEFAADAIDGKGNVLATTDVVRPQPEVLPAKEKIDYLHVQPNHQIEL